MLLVRYLLDASAAYDRLDLPDERVHMEIRKPRTRCGPQCFWRATILLGLPDDQPLLVAGSAVKGERSKSAGREAPLRAEPATKS